MQRNRLNTFHPIERTDSVVSIVPKASSGSISLNPPAAPASPVLRRHAAPTFAALARLAGALALALFTLAPLPASAQLQIGIALQGPGFSIGLNLPAYPNLVRVPGYPVYYAPQAAANYFFYDGLYWVFEDDEWAASSWYNGPWHRVGRDAVPLFLLRVPLRYYRQPPAYFRGGRADAPPRWAEHWGGEWNRRHAGWDRWDRGSAPPPAPLPSYQRNYRGDRYPGAEERQRDIHREQYRYQPRDPVLRQPPPEPPRARPEAGRRDDRRDQGPPGRPEQRPEPRQEEGRGGAERRDRQERAERPERGNAPERGERPERPERPDRPEKPERKRDTP
jgi:hypothetical protein